jgi:hypothetical protein
LPATAFEGVEQRGLFTADIGTGAGVHGDVEVEARAVDVLAEVARGIRLFDRAQQPPVDVDDLAAQIDEGVVAADREGGDRHALDEELRGRHHERDVLAGARLGLVGVDDEIAGPTVRRRQEAPLHAGREASAAAAAQAGVLGHRHQVGRRHGERLLEGLVAVVLLVGRQRPGLGVVPELGEDRRQRHVLMPLLAALSRSVKPAARADSSSRNHTSALVRAYHGLAVVWKSIELALPLMSQPAGPVPPGPGLAENSPKPPSAKSPRVSVAALSGRRGVEKGCGRGTLRNVRGSAGRSLR